MTQSEEKTPWRDHVRGWFRDPTFYRDIVTRTVAGSIVVFFGFLGVLLAGFINRSDHFTEVIRGVLLLLVYPALLFFGGRALKKSRRYRRSSLIAKVAVWYFGGAALLMIVLLCYAGTEGFWLWLFHQFKEE